VHFQSASQGLKGHSNALDEEHYINNVVQTSALDVMKTDLIRAHVHILIIHVYISDLYLGSLTDTIISLLHSFLGHLFLILQC
jgi:hypothetical protein